MLRHIKRGGGVLGKGHNPKKRDLRNGHEPKTWGVIGMDTSRKGSQYMLVGCATAHPKRGGGGY